MTTPQDSQRQARDPRAEYARRTAAWNAEVAAVDRQHGTIANLRLAVFAIGAIAAWAALDRRIDPRLVLVPVVAFIALVVWHARAFARRERAVRARRIYEHGLARLDGTWLGMGADGAKFGAHHPYAHDLDLFGRGSLFQLLNTARTEVGEERLAAWLSAGTDANEILSRQSAVRELRDDVDYRETCASAAAGASSSRTAALLRWSQAPASMRVGASTSFFVALVAVTIALLAGVLTDRLSVEVVFFWLLIQIAIATIWERRYQEEFADLDDAASDLAVLKQVLLRIEERRFVSPRLTVLQSALPADGAAASARIAQLERLVSALDSCANPLVSPLAKLFQLQSFIMLAIALWRRTHGRHVPAWVYAVGELEAFNSLATFAYENPAAAWPEIASVGVAFAATGLAHPLLAESKAVPNDVALGGTAPHVLIVSGSNMSGKSTLLRAIGLNAVLGLAGGPVRATNLRMTPLSIGASIRVDDSLQSGESRFYAELLRIRDVVSLAKSGEPVLFLLDEIFAGTNSFDRRIGAEAIIRALSASSAIGLVTTHDLALTEIVATMAVPAANVHFQDDLIGQTMTFDYTMREGVVERSNALALMRAVGLDV